MRWASRFAVALYRRYSGLPKTYPVRWKWYEYQAARGRIGKSSAAIHPMCARTVRLRIAVQSSHAARAAGVTIAVSLESAAREKRIAVRSLSRVGTHVSEARCGAPGFMSGWR